MSFGPECHYVRFNGKRCGSPALRGKVFCYYHARLRTARQNNVVIPEFDSYQSTVFAARNLLQLMLNRKITVTEYRASVFGLRNIINLIGMFQINAETETEVSRHVAHEVAFAGPDADPEESNETQLAQTLPTAKTNNAAVEQDLSPVAPPRSETPQLSAAITDPFIPGPGDLSATDLHQRRPIPRSTAALPENLEPEHRKRGFGT